MPPPPSPQLPPSLRVYIASCDHASHSHRSPLLLRCGVYLAVLHFFGKGSKKSFCQASISKARVNLILFFYIFFDLVYKSPGAYSCLCLQAFARMGIHNEYCGRGKTERYRTQPELVWTGIVWCQFRTCLQNKFCIPPWWCWDLLEGSSVFDLAGCSLRFNHSEMVSQPVSQSHRRICVWLDHLFKLWACTLIILCGWKVIIVLLE